MASSARLHKGAPPLHATKPDPTAYSEGAQVDVMARALGTPLLPWQRLVAQVAGERLPDGRYRYQTVVVSVPRQSGKTVLIRSVGCQRAAILGRDVFYTAQTGKDAAARFNDLVKVIRSSPWRRRVEIRRAAGSQRVTFHGGGDFQVFAPTAESLHGYTPPTVFLDEAFAHDEAAGELLDNAINPAQQTVLDRQKWIVSTAGTDASVYLRRNLDQGIASLDDPATRTAVFLWAAGDDVDPYTVEGVEAFHPGVGFILNGTRLQAEDIVAESTKVSRSSYERGFANRWTRTTTNLIARDAWRPLKVDDLQAPDPGDLVVTYDVAHDRLSSSVVATWRGDDGRPLSKVVAAAPGSAWLADYVHELADRWGPLAIAADDGGLTRDVTDTLQARGVDVVTTNGVEFSTATARVLGMIAAGGLGHDGGDILEGAALGVATRSTNDGVSISRRHSSGDVSSFVALTVGVWVLDHLPDVAPAPDFVLAE